MNEPHICPVTGFPCNPDYCDFLSPECMRDYTSEFVDALLDALEDGTL